MEYCFDDILLLPRYSELESRKSPDLSTKVGKLTLDIPLISSPMDSITEGKMAVEMAKAGGLGILTRYINADPEASIIKQINQLCHFKEKNNVGAAIGLKSKNIEDSIYDLCVSGVNCVCVDVAHADHINVHKLLRKINQIRQQECIPEFTLMVGNVCTYEAALALADLGVEAIKVGIGSGAICSTRLVTGFGRPQLSAVQDCTRIKKLHPNVSIISDGGCRRTDHVIKALWAGADAVMSGYLFANSSACPKINGERIYRGMSSTMASGRIDIAPEGVQVPVKDKGDTGQLIQTYVSGIKAGLAMAGARNIEELRKCKLVNVSPLSIVETNPYLEN